MPTAKRSGSSGAIATNASDCSLASLEALIAARGIPRHGFASAASSRDSRTDA
jgi:hypothetical protein